MPTFNNNDSLDLSTTKIDDISTVGGLYAVSLLTFIIPDSGIHGKKSTNF